MTNSTTDYFHEAYDRDDIAYGLAPSAALDAYLKQVVCVRRDNGEELGGRTLGRALDLGAGAGRDSLALAAAGFHVTSVDLSRRGLDRIHQRAEQRGLADRMRQYQGDVRDFDLEPKTYDAVIATTVLDHIPASDAKALWQRMCDAITASGVLYVQVHTTEDPGSGQWPGNESSQPISETADAVINYFEPNQLASWAVEPESRLRVLRYEERLEWDYTHGPEHQHGKAVLLAVRQGFHPEWYGQPVAFPRQEF